MRDRKQRVIFGSSVCNWKSVNKGTTQGSVSGPYLFNIFLNDLEIKLGNEALGFKYADDCTIIAPVYDDIDHSADLINQFVRWAGQNRMNSNSTKCKELIMYKKRMNIIRKKITKSPCFVGVFNVVPLSLFRSLLTPLSL